MARPPPSSPWPGPRTLVPPLVWDRACGWGKGEQGARGMGRGEEDGPGSLEKGACCCKVTEGMAYGPTRATCTCGSSGLPVGVDTEPA